MKERNLEVLNDREEVIGIESRKTIHQKGLLHRETHVLFYTPRGGIIFQHRAKDKDTYPDLLDATVGGHVEIGDTYEETAIKEAKEETGVSLNPEDLHFVMKIKSRSEDKVTGAINNAIKKEFAYRFSGDINELQVEEGKAIGFEEWPIDTLLNISDEQRKRFIPGIFKGEFITLYKEIKKLV